MSAIEKQPSDEKTSYDEEKIENRLHPNLANNVQARYDLLLPYI